MKVLITGACSSIGKALTAELEKTHELRLLDRDFPERAAANSGSGELGHWPFVAAEVTDLPSMRIAVDGVDTVVHLAASPTGRPEVGMETFASNALGTFAVLDACRIAGVRKVICASSLNAIGTMNWRISNRPVDYERLPVTEEIEAAPEDPYSLSKLVSEQTCAAFHRAYGITTVALRLAGVWMDAAYTRVTQEGLQPAVEWSDHLWNWIHVADVTSAIRLALDAEDLPLSGVYNLNAADTLCAEPTMSLVERLRPAYLSRLTAPLPGRAALISTAKARAAFGFQPRYRMGP